MPSLITLLFRLIDFMPVFSGAFLAPLVIYAMPIGVLLTWAFARFRERVVEARLAKAEGSGSA